MKFSFLFGSDPHSSSSDEHHDHDHPEQQQQNDIPDRPPTPEGPEDPILLPNEVILQIFPRKLCAYKETPSQKPSMFSSVEPEYFHSYLARHAIKGGLWVTTMRLLLAPLQAGVKGASMDILDIVEMKAIESDLQVWFFLAYLKNGHMFTAPFSTQSRAKAFLKLIHNLQFEHKVRQKLPPPYRRRSESLYDSPRGSIVLSRNDDEESDEAAVEDAIEDEEEEWDENDRHLPSYAESEDAVERYLIDRGLLSEDGAPLMPTESVESGGEEHDRSENEHMSGRGILRRTSTSATVTRASVAERGGGGGGGGAVESTAASNELRRISSRE
ncbi:hypothetical protein BZA70DRAFT_273630 [Myxozyma melibiosi]|uniref:Uncharacterized protein n=1 Tax=Myxozyma melibiosi TaxID=54550 RepID=A0ABR1FF75_9ASCO